MKKPLLADLVAERTHVTLGAATSRTIDRVAEELATELIKEPGFRAHLRALIHQSFTKSVDALTHPAPTRRRPTTRGKRR